MTAFAERMIADLRTFSGVLVETGAGTERGRTRVRPGAEAVLFGSIDAVVGLLPRLLDELEGVEDPRNRVEHRSWSAARASLSRSPSDWTRSGSRIVPQRWVRTECDPEPDVHALAWLLQLVELISAELRLVQRRTARYIEDARRSRRGSSQWADRDLAELERLEARGATAEHALERAQGSIRRRTRRRLRPSARLPSPFPRGRTWRRVRPLAQRIEDKELTLAERIAELLDIAPEVANEPVLYQRWCGMRVIEGLATLGWTAEGDYVGALYLAGHVAFHKEGARIDLWIETRITRGEHESGFSCVRGEEATPDFMVVTPGAGGLDAFVLDATKSTDEEVIEGKKRYLDLLQGAAPAVVAGVVSGPRRPLRSWAMAPFDLGHCRLLAQSGSSGVVPMHPLTWNPGPLRAWLSDLDRHARAWK